MERPYTHWKLVMAESDHQAFSGDPLYTLHTIDLSSPAQVRDVAHDLSIEVSGPFQGKGDYQTWRDPLWAMQDLTRLIKVVSREIRRSITPEIVSLAYSGGQGHLATFAAKEETPASNEEWSAWSLTLFRFGSTVMEMGLKGLAPQEEEAIRRYASENSLTLTVMAPDALAFHGVEQEPLNLGRPEPTKKPGNSYN
jgi:hypothetical protein